MAVVTQFQFRRGTAAQWTSTNPTLAAGEPGFETDTGKFKVGNGSTAWNSLAYVGAGTVTSITAGTGLSGGTITSSGTIAIDSTVATLTGSQTLTNKTISGASNTLSNIENSSLTNSSVTVNGTAISLGASGTVTVPISTGVTGLGTGVATALATNVGTAGAPVVNGGALGTPSSGTLTNATGLPISTGVSGLGAGVATFLATPSSANLASAVTDETGSGALVFGTSPTISGATLTNAIMTQAILTPSFSANAYTLVLGDQGDILLASNGATAGTINVPTNASVAFPTGTQITIIQTGAGQLTIQATTPATTTINSAGATATAPKLRVQNSSATLIKTGTDTWYVVGDIA